MEVRMVSESKSKNGGGFGVEKEALLVLGRNLKYKSIKIEGQSKVTNENDTRRLSGFEEHFETDRGQSSNATTA
ncbi:hypothetical protein SDJN03_20075, partial [Cucurbita argyrosperma subsp. sororia]